MRRLSLGLLLLSLPVLALADEPVRRSPKQALRPFRDLVGSWRCTGTPAGSREDVQNKFWIENMEWQWQFKDKDAWLAVRFDKGKHFLSGELRAVQGSEQYQLTLRTLDQKTVTFKGELADKVLTLERTDEAKKETQRLVFNMLHSNRFLYRYEVRAEGKDLFRRQYQVGNTKEGVPFATGDGQPECIVSGGLGTIPVTFEGKTYYVCCTGCRDEFNASPARYVQEYEARKAKKAQGDNP